MKLHGWADAERKDALKALQKPIYTEDIIEYKAKSEEAAEDNHQQECILSGGVYLRHRLKDNLLPFLQPKYNTAARGVQE